MADDGNLAVPPVGWRRAGAWDGLVPGAAQRAAGATAGVVATLHSGLSAASLIVAEGGFESASRAADAAFGVGLPDRPRMVEAAGMSFVWSGPGHWLAVSSEHDLTARLRACFGPSAAISDQSDSRAIVTLAGPHARDALAKGCMLDLHPRAFRTGDAALSVISYIGVQLWQLSDAPAYRLCVSRSFAGSFWSWLTAASAEFGLHVVHD